MSEMLKMKSERLFDEYSLKGSFEEFITNVKDVTIIIPLGFFRESPHGGKYCVLMKYNDRTRIIEDKGILSNDSIQIILIGLYEAIKQIKRKCDIIIVTSTYLGFYTKDAKNATLCKEISKLIYKKGCYVRLLVMNGAGKALRHYVSQYK